MSRKTACRYQYMMSMKKNHSDRVMAEGIGLLIELIKLKNAVPSGPRFRLCNPWLNPTSPGQGS